MKKNLDSTLHCSFCRKDQNEVGKLISSPSPIPRRAYICDECIAVCNSMCGDDKREGEPGTEEATNTGAFVQHHLAAEFLAAAERWALRDLRGFQARAELEHMRALAARMLRETQQNNPNLG